MVNQHKPLPPDEDIKTLAEWYWDLGLSDTKIVEHLHDHFDKESYGLSVISFRRLRARWGLQGVRKQKHTTESISQSVQHIKDRFPTMGARQMVVTLRQDYQIRVPEQIVATYLRALEPEAVAARKGRRFKRRLFYAAGVNDVWAFDQHNKWKRFGLYLHLGIDPFTGLVQWLKIWWTNRNPRLITSYYLEAVRKQGGVPLVTQSDPGTENYGIANCHTTIRHRLDPSLADTLQHCWMREKSNIKPEIMWSVLRRTWTPGFERILDEGVLRGLYNPINTLEKLVFLWLAIPWLQKELDSFVQRFNTSQRRRNKHKLTPQGIPELIARYPQRYNARDYKVITPPDLLDEMELEFSPPDHQVFEQTPPLLDAVARNAYLELGQPLVSSETFWTVYLDLLNAVQHVHNMEDFADVPQSEARVDNEVAQCSNPETAEIALLPLQQLRMGQEGAGPQYQPSYIGGLQVPPAPMETFSADIENEEEVDLANGELGMGNEESDSELDDDPRFFVPLTPPHDD